jgi:hypothetical protein
MRISGWVVAAFAAQWSAIGCGSGGSSGGPPPPIDRSTEIVAISATEHGELCDWAAAELGGYGSMVSCGNDVTVGAYPSHDACVGQSFQSGCTATVGQYEDCVTAAAPSLCSLLTSPPAVCEQLFASCATALGG